MPAAGNVNGAMKGASHGRSSNAIELRGQVSQAPAASGRVWAGLAGDGSDLPSPALSYERRRRHRWCVELVALLAKRPVDVAGVVDCFTYRVRGAVSEAFRLTSMTPKTALHIKA